MPLKDSKNLRHFLENLYPGLIIKGVPAPSGQRVVYFCCFEKDACQNEEWVSWGDVVLKISEGVTAQAIAYIQREIKILNELDSPGYPDLLYNDVISEDPETEERLKYKLFITFEERVNARPLNEVVDHFNDEKSLVDLLYKLVSVLQPLWQWKPPLIHRDLKPQNILITPDNDVVVIDLGIVREEGADGVTYTLAEFGPCTPQYASPEQAINDKRNITFKSDFFSLGILCYEILDGGNPFLVESNLLDEILERVVKHDPPSLYENNRCSKEFSDLIRKMMEKRPYKRYRRIEDLKNDIAELRGQH